MVKVSNISNFIQKYSTQIEVRVQQVEKWVRESGKGENLLGAEHDIQKVRLGVIGELLGAYALRGILSDSINSIYDFTTLDFRKIDVKTVSVKSSTSLKQFRNIIGYSFYLESKQLHTEVDYLLCYVNLEEDTAIIIDSPILKGSYISKNYLPILKNPPNTSRTTEPNLNYQIPLNHIYSSFLDSKVQTI